MANEKKSNKQREVGRTLTDADVDAIVAKLRCEETQGPAEQHVTSKLEKELMEADQLLAKTFGPVGRIGKRDEKSLIHPSRPKRLVMLKAGHRKPNPNPRKIVHRRVSNQLRANMKPRSASSVQFTET